MSTRSKSNYTFKEPFTRRPIEMLCSPAYRALSLSGRRLLDWLEIELCRHGGKDNGRLIATYDQLVEYGIHRHSIGAAMRETMALGVLVITERGRAGNAADRRPNLFRLPYLPTNEGERWIGPTNEWRKIETIEQAELVALAARKASEKPKFPSAGKCHSQCRKPSLGPVPESVLWTPEIPAKSIVQKPSLLSRYLPCLTAPAPAAAPTTAATAEVAAAPHIPGRPNGKASAARPGGCLTNGHAGDPAISAPHAGNRPNGYPPVATDNTMVVRGASAEASPERDAPSTLLKPSGRNKLNGHAGVDGPVEGRCETCGKPRPLWRVKNRRKPLYLCRRCRTLFNSKREMTAEVRI